MEAVKILIVEEEAIVAESLKKMLQEMGYSIAGVFSNAKKVLAHFIPGFADIIIVDMVLAGDMNGVDLAIELRKISTVPIIYLSDSQDEYLRKKAINETNIVQYLQKPFTQLDISVGIDLAIKEIKRHERIISGIEENRELALDFIYVKDGPVFRKVLLKDILLLRANGSYCDMVIKDSSDFGTHSVLFSENLSFLEKKLAFAKHLIRIHRSHIVNIYHIDKIQGNCVWVAGSEVPIGKTYRGEIDRLLTFL